MTGIMQNDQITVVVHGDLDKVDILEFEVIGNRSYGPFIGFQNGDRDAGVIG